MNKNKGHIIKNVKPGSIAEEMGLEPGDKLWQWTARSLRMF